MTVGTLMIMTGHCLFISVLSKGLSVDDLQAGSGSRHDIRLTTGNRNCCQAQQNLNRCWGLPYNPVSERAMEAEVYGDLKCRPIATVGMRSHLLKNGIHGNGSP